MRHLRRKGIPVLARNMRVGRHDEIDIIAYDPVDRVIVFAEVKTRTVRSSDFRPELNLTHTKKARMIRAARAWTDVHCWDRGYRLDLLCIAGGEVIAHHRDLNLE